MTAAHQEARRTGARAAQRDLIRRQVSFSDPIDVVGAIQDAGLWLMFQPLPKLYGCYERVGSEAGVLINSSHPRALQRFTLAHEYGHHVLGHEGSIDGEAEIEHLQSLDDLQEVAAQAFAAEFLMPLQLVNHTFRNVLGISINPTHLSSHQVYQTSLHLGVSYTAMVNKLVGLGKIDYASAQQLRHVRPKTIKEEINGGPLPNARADVWLISDRQSGSVLRPRSGDRVIVQLDEIPSSGFVWTPRAASQADSHSVSVESDAFGQENGDRVGSPGVHKFVVNVAAEGRAQLRLDLVRPWQDTNSPQATFEVDIHPSPHPAGPTGRGLPLRQQSELAGV